MVKNNPNCTLVALLSNAKMDKKTIQIMQNIHVE